MFKWLATTETSHMRTLVQRRQVEQRLHTAGFQLFHERMGIKREFPLLQWH